mmetsp:Transcript_79563/g.221268  ORF Transcript_79563/g.221268 Transcript_79563/m.221268 type:complete len:141 (+) Transcript_79563:239-661(+)
MRATGTDEATPKANTFDDRPAPTPKSKLVSTRRSASPMSSSMTALTLLWTSGSRSPAASDAADVCDARPVLAILAPKGLPVGGCGWCTAPMAAATAAAARCRVTTEAAEGDAAESADDRRLDSRGGLWCGFSRSKSGFGA